MAETCMELFEKHQLMNIASVEQCCSTGMTSEGRNPKSIVEEMVPLLDDRSIRSVVRLPPLSSHANLHGLLLCEI
jgi:syntaxin-binding protein 1